jgi:hypothetical protein
MSTIDKAIEVNVPVSTAYNQWTQFEDFPKFMEGVEEVRQLDDTHQHWCADVGGKRKEWDAVITEQVPDQRIAWHSTGGAPNGGVVTFPASTTAPRASCCRSNMIRRESRKTSPTRSASCRAAWKATLSASRISLSRAARKPVHGVARSSKDKRGRRHNATGRAGNRRPGFSKRFSPPSRGCDEPCPSMAAALLSMRQANATKYSPASVSASRS